MDFGPLQIVTAWRLTRAGVVSHAIVMQGTGGVRLVVIEDQRIVEWVQFRRIFELREHLAATLKARRSAGWVPWPSGTSGDSALQTGAQEPRQRQQSPARTLLTTAGLE
jgi:hypothetical protein